MRANGVNFASVRLVVAMAFILGAISAIAEPQRAGNLAPPQPVSSPTLAKIAPAHLDAKSTASLASVSGTTAAIITTPEDAATHGGAASVTGAAPDAAARNQMIVAAWDAFGRGDFKGAIADYTQLNKLTPNDPQVLYNLATAHARAGENGMAIWRYLQAQRLAPRDADIRHNLRVLSPQLEEQIAPTPIAPLNWIYERLSANEWQGLAMTLLAAALLSAAIYFLLPLRRQRLRHLVRVELAMIGVATVIVWPLALLAYYETSVVSRGVVVAGETQVRVGPNDRETVSATLAPGTVVRVGPAPAPNWLKVDFATGSIGYIPQSAVRYL